MEYNYFFWKYKEKNCNKIHGFISRENSLISTQVICNHIKQELKKQGIDFPIFAVEQITEKQFNALKRKGYFALGV